MTFFWEACATATLALAALNAWLNDPQDSTWMAGSAITFATLGVVSEHRRGRG